MSASPPVSPPPTEPTSRPRPPFRPGAFWTGVALGLFAIGLIFVFPQRNYGQVIPLVFDAFVLPVIALVLAVVRPTRSLGLGLLLVCGLGWLWLLAICGGALN